MAVLSAYKGLDVVDGATGAGGAALTDNFKELADRAPTKNASDPGATDDANDGYFPGSLWFNATTETMWVCTSAAAGAAVWKSLYTRDGSALTLIPEESGDAVVVAGDLGVGTASPAARLHVTGSTILGADDAAVADVSLGPGQVNVWLDETSGSEKLGFKAKLSGGSVKSGELDLTGGGFDPATLVTLSPATSARNTITPASAAVVPLRIKAAASQTASLLEFQNSGGSTLASVSSAGALSAASLSVGGVALDEFIRDTIAAALTEGTGIDITVDDGADTITIAATSGGTTVPVGTIMMHAGSAAPSGWLLCDGAAVSRTTYADLFTALGGASTPWGTGNGSTTFNVPDLRGRAPIGAGQGSGLSARALAAKGGAETHALSVAEMPSHQHSYSLVSASASYSSGGSSAGPSYAGGFNTGSTGGNGAHNNMSPYAVVNFIVKH